MAECVLADDAFLIAHFPYVVVREPEVWLVSVVTAETGDYSVEAKGTAFPYTATVPPDDAGVIRGQLLSGLATSPWVAAMGVGASSIQVIEQVLGPKPKGLALAVTGPAEGDITAELIGGGDVNAADRELWLAAAECGLPPCCVVTCESDYTLMHAALAAHMILENAAGNVTSTGQGAGDFERMKLGPAELDRGKQQAASQSDKRLGSTVPGGLFISIRDRYVFGFMCA